MRRRRGLRGCRCGPWARADSAAGSVRDTNDQVLLDLAGGDRLVRNAYVAAVPKFVQTVQIQTVRNR